MRLLLALSVIFSLLITSCKKEISGCTDHAASNYNVNATLDNGTCQYADTNYVVEPPVELYPYYCEGNTIICRWRIDSVNFQLKDQWLKVVEDTTVYPSGFMQLYKDNTYFINIDNDTTSGTYDYNPVQWNLAHLNLDRCHSIGGYGFHGHSVQGDLNSDNLEIYAGGECDNYKVNGKNGGGDSTLKFYTYYNYYFTRQ